MDLKFFWGPDHLAPLSEEAEEKKSLMPCTHEQFCHRKKL